MFVIRNQGYFYTDEYFAPDGGWLCVLKDKYARREDAEAACVAYNRTRMRRELLRDFLWDDREAIAAVTALMREAFPDAYDYDGDYWFYEQEARVPEEATDAQVDAILGASKLVFAKVFSYSAKKDDAPLDPVILEELYYGSEAEAIAFDDYED